MTRWAGRFTALAAAAAVALPAYAAEGGEGGVTPFAGDFGNALWTLAIFGIVLFVLGKFAWGPILKGLQAREKFIHDSLAAAQHERQEAEARLREYQERLVGARAEATAIVDESRRDAEAVRRRIEEEAQAEATRIVERARREIGIAKETAVKDLYSLAARMTTGAAAKILEREINPQDHERLIRDSIAELAGKN
jgi:F-type H+-transporting ATPase subunit b